MVRDQKNIKRERSYIMKTEEILDILKNKKVDLLVIYTMDLPFNDYNACLPKEFRLTKEEYNKVKEWLEK